MVNSSLKISFLLYILLVLIPTADNTFEDLCVGMRGSLSFISSVIECPQAVIDNMSNYLKIYIFLLLTFQTAIARKGSKSQLKQVYSSPAWDGVEKKNIPLCAIKTIEFLLR
uniref:Uncharacterized protein n=1 Tax=Strigamia maritima TaxID=126957 RepID=T1IHN3_STRMM